MMVLLEAKSKVLLAPMILFDEYFEWRFEIEWKDRRDEILFRKTLEVFSHTCRDKWEKLEEVEDTPLINEKEVSK